MLFTRRSARAVLILALSLAACADQPTLPPDITVQVMEPVVWAGTDWVLRSPGFARLSTPPTITLDGSAVTATIVDDSTLAVRAPDIGGTHTLRVETPTQILSGAVTVSGYLGKRTALPLGGWPLPVEPGSPVMIVAAESSLVQINATTGVGVPLPIPHDRDCVLSPGWSYHASTVVAATSGAAGCPSLAWSLGATPSVSDSGPLVSLARLVVELSPGTWLQTNKFRVTTIKDGATVLNQTVSQAERVVVAPDGSRVVVLAWTSALVLDPVQGTVAFFLPSGEAQAAAYAPSGDTLFVSGGGAFPGARLRALNPDGDVLLDTSVAGGGIFDLVLDADAPLLYGLFLSHGPAWEPGIRVFDRRTLALIAVVPTVPACASACTGQRRLAIDPVARRLHVLIAANFYGADGTTFPTTILDYSIPPVTQSPLTLVP